MATHRSHDSCMDLNAQPLPGRATLPKGFRERPGLTAQPLNSSSSKRNMNPHAWDEPV